MDNFHGYNFSAPDVHFDKSVSFQCLRTICWILQHYANLKEMTYKCLNKVNEIKLRMDMGNMSKTHPVQKADNSQRPQGLRIYSY